MQFYNPLFALKDMSGVANFDLSERKNINIINAEYEVVGEYTDEELAALDPLKKTNLLEGK